MIRMDRSVVRVTTLEDDSSDFHDMRRYTPAERVGMMWQLVLDAWALQGGSDAGPRLSRDVVRVYERES